MYLYRVKTRAILLLTAAMFVLSGPVDTAAQDKPVKLTILLPLSGVYQRFGTDGRNGFLLGIEQESAKLGIDFSKWVEFEILDSQAEGELSLQLVKESIAGGSQAVLGLISSGVGVAVADYVLNDAKVPLVVFGACATPKLRTTNPLFLRTTFDTLQTSLSLALWSKEHPPVPSKERPLRWACIYADYQAGVDLCDGFKMGYEQVGEEAGRVPVPFKTVNKRKYLIQLSRLKPDFAFTFFAGPELESFIPDYYRFGLHKSIPLLTVGDMLGSHALGVFEKTLDQYGTAIGITSAGYWTPALDNPENRAFGSLYQKKQEQEKQETLPPLFSAMTGYDAGRLLVKALNELDGNWDSLKVMQLMRTLPMTSPRHGRQLTFDSHGDPINTMYIFEMKRDGNRLVNELIGEMPLINLDDYFK